MNDNDIVRRTDIINRLLDRAKPLRGLIHVDEVIRTINVAPSVTPQEPKTGHWIEKEFDGYDSNMKPICVKFECSECGNTDNYDYPFCPYCATKMEEQT